MPDVATISKLLDDFGDVPEDFIWFVKTYGNGCVDDFIYFLNPMSVNVNINFWTRNRSELKTLKECISIARTGEFSTFFRNNHFVFFGFTDNGDSMMWQTNTKPWTIILLPAREEEWEVVEMTFLSFLTRLLNRQLILKTFPEEFPSDSPQFESFDDFNQEKH